MPPDETDAAAEETIEVYPPNWPCVRLFLACETQWRVTVGFGGAMWQGLDYGGVEVVMRRRGFEDVDFADLQVMEAEALAVLGEASA